MVHQSELSCWSLVLYHSSTNNVKLENHLVQFCTTISTKQIVVIFIHFSHIEQKMKINHKEKP